LISAKRIRKWAQLASIGLLLLIQLLINASGHRDPQRLTLLRRPRLAPSNDGVNAVRSAGSGSELIQLSAGLGAVWQLLGRVEPGLARLAPMGIHANSNRSR
jgi:hypothetical protein